MSSDTAHTAQPAQDAVWQLDDLYQNLQDPGIETDRNRCLEMADSFSEKYQGRLQDVSAQDLARAVGDLEEIEELGGKVISYADLCFAVNTQDPEAGRIWQSSREFASAVSRKTLFFGLEWSRLPDTVTKSLLGDPALTSRRHYLEKLRSFAPYRLSNPEEQLLTAKEPAGRSAWVSLFEKVVGALRFGSAGRTLSDVTNALYQPDRTVRKQAAEDLTAGLQPVSHVLAHIINTIALDKSITDNLRSYPAWLTERNLMNEASDKTVDALVQAVTSRYDIVQRYYRLKQNIIGTDRLYDYDRYAPVPGLSEKTYSWKEACTLVLETFRNFSPEFADTAALFFENNWIHAPVQPGKRGGAFAHPTIPSCHPYILVNFTGSQRDVLTLAHELGHGIHQYLAREQGQFNADTPLTMAEVASVFGEMLVLDTLVQRTADKKERLALICSWLENSFATIFRQISMHLFEDGLHRARPTRGELSVEEISDIWFETQEKMFRDSVVLEERYRLWWSYIPHFIHSPGYVYAYAFANLTVLALYNRYRHLGAEFTTGYRNLLASGGSRSPYELLQPLAVDLHDPGFFLQGLDALEELLGQAEHLAG